MQHARNRQREFGYWRFELHAVGRMNGLGAYVKTKDAFFSIPRMTYEDWKKQRGEKTQGP